MSNYIEMNAFGRRDGEDVVESRITLLGHLVPAVAAVSRSCCCWQKTISDIWVMLVSLTHIRSGCWDVLLDCIWFWESKLWM
jgi:hypothetical protein